METTAILPADEVASIDTAQMVEIDRVMVEDLHIPRRRATSGSTP